VSLYLLTFGQAHKGIVRLLVRLAGRQRTSSQWSRSARVPFPPDAPWQRERLWQGLPAWREIQGAGFRRVWVPLRPGSDPCRVHWTTWRTLAYCGRRRFHALQIVYGRTRDLSAVGVANRSAARSSSLRL